MIALSEQVSASPDSDAEVVVEVEPRVEDEKQDDGEREESDDGRRSADADQKDERTEDKGAEDAGLRVTEEQLSGLARDSADAAAASVASTVEDAVRSGVEESNQGLSATVTLSDTQYQELRSILASDLQTSVVSVGVCSLILGSVVGVALTLHWRGGRG